jgi:hypothetical protein
MLGRDPETSPVSDEPRINELPFSALRRRPHHQLGRSGSCIVRRAHVDGALREGLGHGSTEKRKDAAQPEVVPLGCAVLPGHAAGEPLTYPQHPLEVTNGRPTSLPGLEVSLRDLLERGLLQLSV